MTEAPDTRAIRAELTCDTATRDELRLLCFELLDWIEHQRPSPCPPSTPWQEQARRHLDQAVVAVEKSPALAFAACRSIIAAVRLMLPA